MSMSSSSGCAGPPYPKASSSEDFLLQMFVGWGKKKAFTMNIFGKIGKKTGLSCFVCWWFQISVFFLPMSQCVTVCHGSEIRGVP